MPYIGNQPAPTNVNSSNITDGSIVNADINASAAIAVSKLDGVTSTNTELNLLDGVTATTAELNFVDGVTSNVQTQVDAKAPYATIAVTVVNSGGNKYVLDGTTQQLALLTPSVTYRFDQSDSSNSGHPLLLSTTSNGTHGGGSAFTTGVTAVGTPGSAGAYTQVKLEQDAPDTLYYYCSSHSGMGGEIDVRATVSSLSDLSVTSTAAELNILDGVTSTAAELNILDGVTATTAELNYVDGVTSSIQTQLDAAGGATNINGLSDATNDGLTMGMMTGALANDDGSSNSNVAIGRDSQSSVTSGAQNTSIGNYSHRYNVTGNYGVAVGYEALRGANGSSHSNNVGIGWRAATSVSTGDDNTIIGYKAGNALNTADNCVFIGSNAGLGNTSGAANMAIGFHTMALNTIGGYNTCLGHNAGYATVADDSVFIGASAGSTATTGSNKICIGRSAQPSSATSANEITLGSSSIATFRCQVQSISGLSDERDKTKIESLDVGLNFINALRPVSFEWDMRDKGRVGDADTGFIAQELAAVLANQNATIPGLVTTAQNANGEESFEASYAKLIPSMVLAIQELKTESVALKAENDALKARVTALEDA